MSSRRARIQEQPAFLLRATAWKEHSCVVTLLSQDHGLVAGVAKGAKRPYATLRPILSHFQPLLVSWSGQGDMKTITQAEFDGFYPMPADQHLSAWYLNELLLRGLWREAPMPVLFDEYALALSSLAQGLSPAAVLRRFEWCFLQELGYGFEGMMPNFYQPEIATEWRGRLQQAIREHITAKPLSTRTVWASFRKLGVGTL